MNIIDLKKNLQLLLEMFLLNFYCSFIVNVRFIKNLLQLKYNCRESARHAGQYAESKNCKIRINFSENYANCVRTWDKM